eukprot:7283644-Prymnesium_polylepis.2
MARQPCAEPFWLARGSGRGSGGTVHLLASSCAESSAAVAFHGTRALRKSWRISGSWSCKRSRLQLEYQLQSLSLSDSVTNWQRAHSRHRAKQCSAAASQVCCRPAGKPKAPICPFAQS